MEGSIQRVVEVERPIGGNKIKQRIFGTLLYYIIFWFVLLIEVKFNAVSFNILEIC